MYCPNCKTVFDNDDFAFCPKCGTKGVGDAVWATKEREFDVRSADIDNAYDDGSDGFRCDRCGLEIGDKAFYTLNGETLCVQCGRYARLDGYLNYSKFRTPISATIMYVAGALAVIVGILSFFTGYIALSAAIVFGGLAAVAIGGAIID